MAIPQWILDNLPLIVAVGGLVVYAVFVGIQTRTMRRQTKIMQESKWFPEAFFNAKEGRFYFRGKRPWFPEFRASMNGKQTKWWENNFYPVQEDTILMWNGWSLIPLYPSK